MFNAKWESIRYINLLMTYDSSVVFSQYYSFPNTVLYLCMGHNLGVPKLNLHTVLYLCMAHNLGVPKLRDPNIYAMLQFNSVIQSLLFWLWHLNQLKIT